MPPKKRKASASSTTTTSKKQKTTPEEMPLATRTIPSTLKKTLFIGAHVSAAGGVQNSIPNATHIGANSFALFLKSQRKWTSPPITADSITAFHANLKSHDFAGKHILPHGSYLVNLAQADPGKAAQAYTNFIDDLHRCEKLGIQLYNFHPGSTGGAPKKEAIARIAKQLNKAHKETKSVVTLVENMAGSGNIVGGDFEDLRDIIEKIDDKSRIGVCIDTCHAFAAGHDLRTPEAYKKTMAKFDEIVGAQYLRALHLNDSKAPFNSNRDVHANIGTGFLGLRAFHCIVNDARFEDMPIVLETPIDKKDAKGKSVEDKQVWADEIKLLESMVGMDAEGEEFKGLEKELVMRGEGERKKLQDQVDRKKEKDAKKGGGRKVKGKKKIQVETTDEESGCESCS